MRIELIQWRNGKFGIRKTSWFRRPEFYGGVGYWWTEPHHVCSYAYMTKERAVELLNSLTDYGTPVTQEPQA